MTVHIVPEHVPDSSKHQLLRLFTCGAWTGINGLFPSLISDTATEGGLDGPLITTDLPEGQMYVAPHDANILGVIGDASIYRAHAFHLSVPAY